ncbi:cytochrome P450 [Dendrothele bispora CBS 962.96]|uniref:Cytochrome P450 n=1 Tax=Dendrothele bispora (strain CBS 962.96) TaxID=1314807 RepID=A0A4S8KW01_DENBC|nr:cytochrome P450 [Dendrothele bispora CBS 962.96]
MALSLPTVGLLCALFVVVHYISKSRRKSLKFLRGPTAPSWLYGNELELNHQFEVGKLEEPWFQEYGTVFRSTGCFGEENLNVIDPKALQHILHASSYRYPKVDDIRKVTRRIFGRAIVWAEGSVHSRHRKAMNPAFSASQLRTFLSLFQRSTRALCDKWQSEFFSSSTNPTTQEEAEEQTINMFTWLPRLTLDVIGEAAFDYKFNALESEDNVLANILRHLFDDTTGVTKRSLFFTAVRRWLPWDPTFYNPLNPDVPLMFTKQDRRFNSWLEASKNAGRDILKQKSESGDTGVEEGSKDILSVLIRSNHLSDPDKRLDDEEVLSQIATIILAGHETTASSTAWILYELSRHPENQKRIREEFAEVRRKKQEAGQEGEEAFSPNDYDSMPFFNAVIKEGLRLYPIVISLFRCPDRDDVIPLSEPVISASGEKLNAIPVKEGQRIVLNLPNYNRLKSVWGPDADVWNPERFLDNTFKQTTTLGVYANLMNFSAGIRACIGWRFALLELQALVGGLVTNFEFSIDPSLEIFRAQIGTMVPVVRGKEMERAQMPLKVRPVRS